VAVTAASRGSETGPSTGATGRATLVYLESTRYWTGRSEVAGGPLPSSGSPPALNGRRTECDVLDRLLADMRGGQSGALVVRGEAGIGKTALLDYLAERAAGCRIARATGVESEMEVACGGLHQLCGPMLDRLDRLPEPQRNALEAAFGRGNSEVSPDRFVVGLAVLSLLADAAEDRPLVCLVDDAQWLDRLSLDALAFVARRLVGERIALVFAAREPSDGPELEGLPGLAVGGLSDVDALALLDSVVVGPVDERVRARIVAETRGNPLALIELPRGLTPAELAGGFGLPDTMPLASRIELGFLRRLEPLPPQTRRLLLTAAAEPIGDVTLLWRAAELLGIAPDSAAPAETEGLIEIGTRVRFRHPLVRSAACRAAGLGELQKVHWALAEATDPDLDPDRRAWHRALAAAGPDEAAADELERSAARVQRRGGVAAAAAYLERAVELTPDPARRGERALVAAQAKLDAGAAENAVELLATARLCPLDDLQRARLERLRAQVAFLGGRGKESVPLLVDAAGRLGPLDARLARETYLEALGAGIYAGRLGDGDALERAAREALATHVGPGPPTSADRLVQGLAVWLTEGHAAAVPSLRAALAAFAREEEDGAEVLRWFWLVAPVALELWDPDAWHELCSRSLSIARDLGALSALSTALIYNAGVLVHEGRFADAEALNQEADAINQAAGNPPLTYTELSLAAWRGRETPALELIEHSIEDASARGEGRTVALAEYGRVVLYIGLGRYEQAHAAARRVCEHEDLALFGWTLPELIEAAARTGDHAAATAAMSRLERRTSGANTAWARGIEARCRALVSDGDDADALYREAIEQLAGSRIELHLARAQLLYGEWLRRERRRVDAREQLRAAHEFFDRGGERGFAERARRELLATGETVRKRSPETRDDLTPQEAHIARLAREGRTNPEIGAELFISPRTVEWHLGKVFWKLGISSRRELRDALPHAGRQAAAV
jgi:DNA-binding CsgD family transcriptional regulator/tetratricopeptide (TPR) repeat protein